MVNSHKGSCFRASHVHQAHAAQQALWQLICRIALCTEQSTIRRDVHDEHLPSVIDPGPISAAQGRRAVSDGLATCPSRVDTETRQQPAKASAMHHPPPGA